MKAIWARSLMYWFKDPRYSTTLLVVVVLVAIGVVQLTVIDTKDISRFAKIIPVMIAYLTSFSISADLSYDSTGYSLHVTSGVKGVDDRLGRTFALLTWALPVVIVLTVGMVFMTNTIEDMAAWLGLSIGVLLSGTAVSAIISARYIYPVPPLVPAPWHNPKAGWDAPWLFRPWVCSSKQP